MDSKSCGFVCRIYLIRVDGSRIRKEKVADSKNIRIRVNWPKWRNMKTVVDDVWWKLNFVQHSHLTYIVAKPWPNQCNGLDSTMLCDEQNMLQRFKRSLSKNSINQRELRDIGEDLQFCPKKPRSHVRILIYRTGAIDVVEIMIPTYLFMRLE